MSESDPFEELELIMRLISCKLNQIDKNAEFNVIDNMFDELLHLLSHRTRRRMLYELSKHNLFVNEIVELLNEHPQSIIRHLRALKDLNIVDIDSEDQTISKGQKGRPRTYYKLNPSVRTALSEGEQDEEIPLETKNYDIALLFPRLQVLRNRLRNACKPSELNQVAKEGENLFQAYEKALEECKNIIQEALSKIKPIKID